MRCHRGRSRTWLTTAAPMAFAHWSSASLNVRFEQFVVETFDCFVDAQDRPPFVSNLEGTRITGGPAANSVIDRWDWLDVVSRLQDLFPRDRGGR